MQTQRERDRSLPWQRVLVVMGIFLFFALESQAFAQGPPGWAPPRPGCARMYRGAGPNNMPAFWENPAMVKYLQLSPAQVTALKKAGDATGRQAATLRNAIRQSRLDLEKAFRESPINEPKVKGLAAKLAEDESRLSVLQIEQRLQAVKLLTAQQQKAIEALRPPCWSPS